MPDSEDHIVLPSAPSGKVQIGIARPKTPGEAPKIFLHAEQGDGKILFMFSIDEATEIARKILSEALRARKPPVTRNKLDLSRKDPPSGEEQNGV